MPFSDRRTDKVERHCERSEAIQLKLCAGLLRSARNDGSPYLQYFDCKMVSLRVFPEILRSSRRMTALKAELLFVGNTQHRKYYQRPELARLRRTKPTRPPSIGQRSPRGRAGKAITREGYFFFAVSVGAVKGENIEKAFVNISMFCLPISSSCCATWPKLPRLPMPIISRIFS